MKSEVFDESGAGDYLSPEFLRCIRKKMDLVVRSIAENPGKIIGWSDVDIRIFELTPERLISEVEASQNDILFQRESPCLPDINAGFFVCRCTPAIQDFFQNVRSELSLHPDENEQMVINRLLQNRKCATQNLQPRFSWGYLPRGFYARTHGWPPPRRLAIYHANYTKGTDAIGQKLAQFREVDGMVRGGLPARLLSIARRIPGRVFRPSSKDN